MANWINVLIIFDLFTSSSLFLLRLSNSCYSIEMQIDIRSKTFLELFQWDRALWLEEMLLVIFSSIALIRCSSNSFQVIWSRVFSFFVFHLLISFFLVLSFKHWWKRRNKCTTCISSSIPFQICWYDFFVIVCLEKYYIFYIYSIE